MNTKEKVITKNKILVPSQIGVSDTNIGMLTRRLVKSARSNQPYKITFEKSTYLVVKMSNRIPTRYRGWIFHFLVTASRPILAGEVSSKLSAQLQAI